MELSIKENNLTVSKTIVNETVDETVEAAFDVIVRIFGEQATEEAFKRLQI